MRLGRALWVAALFAPISLAVEGAFHHAVTVWTWPIDASAPTELVNVYYDPDSLAYDIKSYRPPETAAPGPDDMVRVGLYDPKTTEWHGSVTSAESFDSKLQHKLFIHLDQNGEAYHVSFVANERPKIKKTDPKLKEQPPPKVEPLLIEIVKPTSGPVPHLNRPVVLDATGRLPEKEEEKTFLQKYWWAFAIFIILQLGMAGGGGDK